MINWNIFKKSILDKPIDETVDINSTDHLGVDHMGWIDQHPPVYVQEAYYKDIDFLVNLLSIADYYMIFCCVLLMLTLAFYKFKSKLVYIKMIIYTYVLITCVYGAFLDNLMFKNSINAMLMEHFRFHNFSLYQHLWSSFNFSGSYIKLLVICLFLVLFIILLQFSQFETFLTTQYIFSLFFLSVSIILLLNSNDLIYMYLSLELFSLILYVLACTKKYSNYSSEASLKYFVLGSLASAFILLGLAFFYGVFGTCQLNELKQLNFNWNLFTEFSVGFYLALVFLTLGFTFKLGLFPFHMWLPDVYQSNIFMTLVLTTLPKLAILTILIKLHIIFFNESAFLINQLWLVIALISMVIGTFAAFYQTNIMRFWAYSAINQLALIMCNFIVLNQVGFASALFYMITYILISFNFFMVFLFFRIYKSNVLLQHIKEVGLVFRHSTLMAIYLSLALFSLAGIPPLAGFFAKFTLIANLAGSSEFVIVFIIIVMSCFSTFYYLRLIRLIFFKKQNKGVLLVENKWFCVFIMVVLGIANLAFIFLLQSVYGFTVNLVDYFIMLDGVYFW